ncbi:hypothetical protein [Amaricoccus sp.]|uniref:hypothetical protein n=1 Tax=Amaricoccus sp. TaxID=1872485 RepID=UPI0026242DDC|nr:hypothetical protein [uncultured Amaricoccus sp.]
MTGRLDVSDIMLDRHGLIGLVRAATNCPRPPPPRADAAAFAVMATDRLRAFGRDPTGRARLKADLAAAEPAPA